MASRSTTKANEYKLKWMTTEGEDLELEGFAGAEIWLDPEGHTFMRLNYGSYERLREVVTNMIKRDMSNFPVPHYHLSCARMLGDQWEMFAADKDYGVSIFHFLETLRFAAAEELSWSPQQWVIWYKMDYIFKRSTASSVERITSATQMKKLMLFSEHQKLFTDYMGNLANDILPRLVFI